MVSYSLERVLLGEWEDGNINFSKMEDTDNFSKKIVKRPPVSTYTVYRGLYAKKRMPDQDHQCSGI